MNDAGELISVDFCRSHKLPFEIDQVTQRENMSMLPADMTKLESYFIPKRVIEWKTLIWIYSVSGNLAELVCSGDCLVYIF